MQARLRQGAAISAPAAQRQKTQLCSVHVWLTRKLSFCKCSLKRNCGSVYKASYKPEFKEVMSL